jgi:predicted ArsR family transcriptional regulator
MTQPGVDDLLICLRIKGFGKPEAIAEALGISAELAQGLLDELVAQQLAEPTKVGHRLSPSGRARADGAFALERASVDQSQFAQRYEEFSPINDTFKQLVTRWQVRTVGDKQIRNDHSDQAYDQSVLEGLDPRVHRDISQLIDSLAASVARLGGYKARLERALGRIRSGDIRYLTAPDRDSYHTVWFELHQDLIGLAGTTRQKEAAAGRAT